MQEARRIRRQEKSSLKNKKNLKKEDYFSLLKKEYQARIENGCYNPTNMDLSGASMPMNAINENIEKALFELEKVRKSVLHLHSFHFSEI